MVWDQIMNGTENVTGLNKAFRTEDVTGLKPYTETVDTLLECGSGAFRKPLKLNCEV